MFWTLKQQSFGDKSIRHIEMESVLQRFCLSQIAWLMPYSDLTWSDLITIDQRTNGHYLRKGWIFWYHLLTFRQDYICRYNLRGHRTTQWLDVRIMSHTNLFILVAALLFATVEARKSSIFILSLQFSHSPVCRPLGQIGQVIIFMIRLHCLGCNHWSPLYMPLHPIPNTLRW